jgi:hypothetical protein
MLWTPGVKADRLTARDGSVLEEEDDDDDMAPTVVQEAEDDAGVLLTGAAAGDPVETLPHTPLPAATPTTPPAGALLAQPLEC